jgi:hypothetical protein
VEELDRDRAAEHDLLGEVHAAHPTLADALAQRIPAVDLIARLEVRCEIRVHDSYDEQIAYRRTRTARTRDPGAQLGGARG